MAAAADAVGAYDGSWIDLEAVWTAAADQAGCALLVRGWFERDKGSADAYGYFDEISLVRTGGMVIEPRQP